jgi:large subunit ribosomal protein L32
MLAINANKCVLRESGIKPLGSASKEASFSASAASGGVGLCPSPGLNHKRKEKNMAVPKRRVSHTRAAKRRTHYKIKLARPVKDSDGTYKMPHHVNPTTGEYK